MLNTQKISAEMATAGSDKLRGLVWNEDLSLQSDSNAAVQQRRQAIDRARASRPRTAHIEREHLDAVPAVRLGVVERHVGIAQQQFGIGERVRAVGEAWADPLLEERCVRCHPGGNGYGPMRELGRFYEMLLSRGALPGPATPGFRGRAWWSTSAQRPR